MAAALKKEVEECRFFPELVWASVSGALGHQRMLGYLVHHEASFATGDLQRHLTALVLTDRQLIISHTDEQDGGHCEPFTLWSSLALSTIPSAIPPMDHSWWRHGSLLPGEPPHGWISVLPPARIRSVRPTTDGLVCPCRMT